MAKANPFLIYDEDPFEHAKDEVTKVQNESIEFQRLCFTVFHQSEDGKKLYEMLKAQYLLQAKWSPTDPTAATQAIYWEGFRECIRGLYNMGLIHLKRVNR